MHWQVAFPDGHDRMTGKTTDTKTKRSFLTNSMKGMWHFNRYEVVQKQNLKNWRTHKQVDKILPGWDGKSKVLVQDLWERGLLNLQLLDKYTMEGKKIQWWDERISSNSLEILHVQWMKWQRSGWRSLLQERAPIYVLTTRLMRCSRDDNSTKHHHRLQVLKIKDFFIQKSNACQNYSSPIGVPWTSIEALSTVYSKRHSLTRSRIMRCNDLCVCFLWCWRLVCWGSQNITPIA